MCASFKLQMSLDLSFEWKAVDHSGFAVSVAFCGMPKSMILVMWARLVSSHHQVLAASEEVSVPRFEKRSRKSEDQRLHITLLIFAPIFTPLAQKFPFL